MTTTVAGDTKLKAAADNRPAAVELETSQPLSKIMLETSVRTCAALLFGLFAYRATMHWWADPARITLLLLVVSECIVVVLSLFARIPGKRDWMPLALLSSIAGSYYFIAVQLAPGVKLVPESVGVGLQIVRLAKSRVDRY
ncbi:hypothetical protein [Paraburkholderia sp. A3RO-2L]|uniref:hypothetical protein n=1 Tax=Paraburkholderia sp. A3RO-2L TaxID=3028376 RepID=UPI003DA941F8